MKRQLLCLLLLLVVLPLEAQIRGNNIVVTVEPDHQDWNYKVGEKCKFNVEVRRSGTLLDNVDIDYEAGPEMYPDVKKSTTLKNGTMTYTGQMKAPGFYRLKVTAHVGGKDYSAWCTAAYSPEMLKPTTVDPKDFDQFWAKAIEEARWTKLEPTKTLLPERCHKT